VGASQGLAGSNIGIAIVPAASAPTGSTGTGEITIADYAGTTLHKGVVNTHQNRRADTSGNFFFSTRVGDWRSTSAVTSVTLALGSGNYAAGSKLTAYGLMQ
jgi:hypothetical protein